MVPSEAMDQGRLSSLLQMLTYILIWSCSLWIPTIQTDENPEQGTVQHQVHFLEVDLSPPCTKTLLLKLPTATVPCMRGRVRHAGIAAHIQVSIQCGSLNPLKDWKKNPQQSNFFLSLAICLVTMKVAKNGINKLLVCGTKAPNNKIHFLAKADLRCFWCQMHMLICRFPEKIRLIVSSQSNIQFVVVVSDDRSTQMADSSSNRTGVNSTEYDSDLEEKRHIYALTFKITLVVCMLSIVVVTAVLVVMVIYAKYKGWKSRNIVASAPTVKTGEPAPFPLSHRPSLARNPMDP